MQCFYQRYAVYIIHPLVVTLATYAYAELLRAGVVTTTTMWVMESNGTALPTTYQPEPLDVFPGFYTGATLKCPGVKLVFASSFNLIYLLGQAAIVVISYYHYCCH